MEASLELHHLAADPCEEWQRMLRFVNLTQDERAAMLRTVETLLQRAREFVVATYDYLRSVPETAAILGWETQVDEEHLEERRRFFTLWLSRTLGIDTSDEFAQYLFRAGHYHAGLGPRRIHTPAPYVTTSIGLTLAAFARYMHEADLAAETIALAMAGWSKYLSVQLNQMLFGYQIAREFINGDFKVRLSLYGRLRSIVGAQELSIAAHTGDTVADLLRKFFNYYPQVRAEALDRLWHSEEKETSSWPEITPVYVPRRGWRVLLNGRDLAYERGFTAPVHKQDEIALFPPGR